MRFSCSFVSIKKEGHLHEPSDSRNETKQKFFSNRSRPVSPVKSVSSFSQCAALSRFPAGVEWFFSQKKRATRNHTESRSLTISNLIPQKWSESLFYLCISSAAGRKWSRLNGRGSFCCISQYLFADRQLQHGNFYFCRAGKIKLSVCVCLFFEGEIRLFGGL